MSPQGRPAPRMSVQIRWLEMRCVWCHHLLQKVEKDALRPGKCLEIKCPHCKVINSLVGRPADTRADAERRGGAAHDRRDPQRGEDGDWD